MHRQLNRHESISRIRKSHERHDQEVESIMRTNALKLMPKSEKEFVVEEVFGTPTFPLNPTLRKVEKDIFRSVKEREPVDLESELADNGYDEWLDVVFERKKYILPPVGTKEVSEV